MIELLAILIAGHALADYPLQGEFLAMAKNHKKPIPGVPWYQALLAHSAIHGLVVGVITGSLWIGLAEFVVHNIIDYSKCDERISFNVDQSLHVLFKIIWVAVIFWP